MVLFLDRDLWDIAWGSLKTGSPSRLKQVSRVVADRSGRISEKMRKISIILKDLLGECQGSNFYMWEHKNFLFYEETSLKKNRELKL